MVRRLQPHLLRAAIPQSLYTDLSKLIPKEEIDKFVLAHQHQRYLDRQRQARDAASGEIRRLGALLSQEQLHRRREEEGVQGQIRLRPRAAHDLSADEGPGDLFREPAELLRDRIRRQGGGAINGRFYEMVVAEGGEYLDAKGKPAFNSDAGVRALNWFVDLYKAKAVPTGTTNYLWDDLSARASRRDGRPRSRLAGLGDLLQRSEVIEGCGQRWHRRPAGWLVRQALGLVWQPRRFPSPKPAITRIAAASLVWWLTNDDSQKIEAANGSLPTRPAVWDWDIAQAANDPYKKQVLATFQESADICVPVPPLAMDRDFQRRLS